ncbi:MAG: hydantoinase/oxoprolinase family protein, partial [Verrucomicrobiota bacterium]
MPSDFFKGWQVGFGSEVARIEQSELLEEGIHELRLDRKVDLQSETDLFTGEEAPVIGSRILTQTGLENDFPEISLRLATTRGTNALLEKKGARMAFFVTQGFGDLLHIRDQRRPDLFALNHQLPEPLYEVVCEVSERLDADGNVLEPLSLSPELQAAISGMVEEGIEVAAVSLMHGYLNDQHEKALAHLLRNSGFKHVSLSSELAPLIKLLPRAETTVVDAYLTPVMGDFLNRVSKVTSDLLVMTSAGGLEPESDFRPKDSLFSGPAGGVVGAAASAKLCGYEKLITFDMGGTSTDVARFNGDFAYQFQQSIGATTLLSPSLRIETVAAGGGSICQWSQGGLRVGPESAGSSPGPACYGRGGPLTITDVNVLLGRVDPDNFGIPLGKESIAAAETRLLELMQAMETEESREEVLEGLLRIAVEQMADSIGTISIREGANPSEYALLAFGGAGPLHACAIADRLGMSTILVPAEAGVLSAYGLHHAEVERFAERQILKSLADCAEIEDWLSELQDEASAKLGAESKVRRRIAELRLSGQEAPLDLEIGEPNQLPADFRAKYQTIFGYEPQPHQKIELV